jgi:DNA-binding transcriptional LysR family regulator
VRRLNHLHLPVAAPFTGKLSPDHCKTQIMDKSRALSLFIKVVRAGSFSQAAIEEALTPQAVSKSVRQLEAWLGVRLFHRSTRNLSLTDEGQRLFELADPGLQLLDHALDQLQASRHGSAGVVRVAASSSLGRRVVIPLIGEFQRTHGETSFDVQLDDQVIDLVEARIDVGFRAGRPPQRNLVSRRLAAMPLVICATPDYLARHGTPHSIDDLAAHRCTGYRQPNSGRIVPWTLQSGDETLARDVPCVFSANTADGEVEAVLLGVGIGQLSRYVVRDALADGRLVEILPGASASEGAVYMCYQQRTQMPSRVRAFIDFVSDHAERFGGLS